MSRRLRPLWLLPPLLVAVALVLILPKFKQPPQPIEQAERAVKVRVIEAFRAPIVARVSGYGLTEPVPSWRAVAEVAGRVVWRDARLEAGHLVAKGTPLLRIDPAPYELALTQAQAQLAALAVKQRTTQALLDLEEQGQALLKRELERKRKLNRDGSLSTALLEESERAWLKGEVTLQGLRNTLALTEAEQAVARTQQAAAELDLANTELKAPYDLRLTEVTAELAQYVAKGQTLLEGDGLEAVEVVARFPIGRLRPLLAKRGEEDDEEGSPLSRTPGPAGLEAKVRLYSATQTLAWSATVDRVSAQVDTSQTLGVVVRVDKPYAQAKPGERPPLMRGTQVEVELRKPAQGQPVLVPASAIRQGKLYLLDTENRLVIRQVKPALLQGAVAALPRGVEPGERVVISKLEPAVEGTLLDPELDEELPERLKQEALGTAPQGKGGGRGQGGGA